MCCDSPSAPAPDPAIGQAALANSDIAKAQLQIGKDQLAWNKEQYADLAPTLKKILQQQVDIGNISQERADAQWQQYSDTFMPIEKKVAQEAMAEGGADQQTAEAEKARAQVAGSFESNRASTERDMARSLGVNPASMKSAAFKLESGNEQASAEAGAANTARTNARMRGIALRSGAAQFGRNMPQTGIASDSLALSAGSNAANTGTGSIAAANAGVNSAMPWYSGATAGNNSAGNMYLGQFGAQMQGYNAQTQAQSGLFQGLGTLGGVALSKWGGMGAGLAVARGGILGKGRVIRKGYAGGGIVTGPGDGSVDTVPAVVDGKQPAALANGEGVLNEPATKLVGEDFVHRMNKAGLMLKQILMNGVSMEAAHA